MLSNLRMYNLPLKELVLGPILAEVARTEGKRTYLRFLDKSFSFEDTYSISRAIARGLRREGLSKQESVAVLLPNCVEFIFILRGEGHSRKSFYEGR